MKTGLETRGKPGRVTPTENVLEFVSRILNLRFSNLLEPPFPLIGINFPAAEKFQHTLTSRRKREETKRGTWLEKCRNWDKRLSKNYVFIRFVKAAGLFWRVLGNGWPVNIKKKREKRTTNANLNNANKFTNKCCKQMKRIKAQSSENDSGEKQMDQQHQWVLVLWVQQAPCWDFHLHSTGSFVCTGVIPDLYNTAC